MPITPNTAPYGTPVSTPLGVGRIIKVGEYSQYGKVAVEVNGNITWIPIEDVTIR
jgi:hypothetical protein